MEKSITSRDVTVCVFEAVHEALRQFASLQPHDFGPFSSEELHHFVARELERISIAARILARVSELNPEGMARHDRDSLVRWGVELVRLSGHDAEGIRASFGEPVSARDPLFGSVLRQLRAGWRAGKRR